MCSGLQFAHLCVAARPPCACVSAGTFLILQLMHTEVNTWLLHLADEALEEKGKGLTAA